MAETADPSLHDPRLAQLRAVNDALERQNARLKHLVVTYDRLSGQVLQSAGLDAITRLFADLVDHAVTVLDPLLQPLAAAAPARGGLAAPPIGETHDWSLADPHLRQVLAAVAVERRPLRIPPIPGWEIGAGWVIAPIVVGPEILGYLVMGDGADAGDELDLLAIQHAATVYAIALMHERLAMDVANRLRGELIEALLLGQATDAQRIRERAVRLGYDLQRTYRVLALVPDGLAGSTGEPADDAPVALALRRRFLAELVELLASRAPQAIAVARADEVVLLAPEPRPGDAGQAVHAGELGAGVARQVQPRFPDVTVTIGVSGPCDEPAELPRAYTQARQAVETARRFGRRGEVVAFEDLGLYRLLYQVADPNELRGFAEQVLGALLAYDREHQADFLRTLAAYLRYHGNVQNAARELIVHANTVSYRLRRIQTITGLDLEDADDRLAAQVALKILTALEPR
jgi:DNA-binding PucR family transcriptional regulator